MASQISHYDSQDSDADSLFNEPAPVHDTVATLPISNNPFQTAPSQNATFVTQPTQPWHTPNIRQSPSIDTNGAQNPSSPSVQVAASSPAQPRQALSYLSPGPTTAPLRRGALNGGISAMAPPGTQFRHPTQAATQQTIDFSDHEGPIDSSDDEERRRVNDIKPSVFMKNGRPIAPGRVQESPKSQGFGDVVSRFSYEPSPQKRAAPDDMATAYSNPHRNKKPRQAGPARAQPVQAEMTLNDIPDWQLRQKVIDIQKVLPDRSIRRIYQTLIAKRGHETDAMNALVEEEKSSIDLTQSDEDELAHPKGPSVKQTTGKSVPIAAKYTNFRDAPSEGSSPPPMAQMRPQAKQQVTSRNSIADRYSTTTRDQGADKPRKRLVRGTGQATVSPQLPSSPVQPPPRFEARKPRAIVSDDDDDSGVGDDEEEDELATPETEAKLLAFMNEASALALQDLSGQSDEIISKVIQERPYSDLDKIRKVCIETTTAQKNGKQRTTRKAVGDRLVDACLAMWIGYEAVDQLVARCEQLGKPIAAEMKQWGFDAFGASNGELEVTALDLVSNHDSGIGTPSSTGSHEDGDIKWRTVAKKPVLQQPKSMSETLPLKDYQIAGMNWLALLYSHGLSGILADDMGLGKTCQVIAFLAHLKEQGITHGPHLIVAPGSTLENWIREIQRFCPSLRLEPYYGKHTERPEQQLRIQDAINDIDVIVTTYDMAYKPSDNKFLRKLPLVVCVYDEAHKLKNSTSMQYKSLMRIPASQMRLLLTGTPLQNNLMELGSMLAFLMPALFGAKEEELSNVFKHKAKVEKSTDHASAENDAKRQHDALLSQERIARARSMLTPFILRRKKHQVLKQLPKKTNRVEHCELVGAQQSLYKMIEDNLAQVLEQRKLNASEDSKAKKKATEKIKDFNKAPEIKDDKKSKTNILMDLRKAAIHPLLFRRLYSDDMLRRMAKKFKKLRVGQDINEQYVFEDFCEMSDMELHKFCTDTEPSFRKEFALKKEPWMDSAKVQSLLKILKSHAENGHRTLIFSQFTQVMNILEVVFETTSTRFFRLDGQTKMDTRQDMIDLFTAEAEADNTARATSTKPSNVDEDDGDSDVAVASHRRTHGTPQKSKDKSKTKAAPEAAAVFMLSTRAGGQGINLTAADRVVIFDSGFNPHDDVQAENRAHRVGQTREVEVVKLVAKGTIEEDILRLGLRKVKLDEMVAGAGDASGDRAGDQTANGIDEGPEDSVQEKEGQSLVEKMLADRLAASKATQNANDDTPERKTSLTERTTEPKQEADVSKTFMKGLMSAGLDMSAATAPIKLGGGSPIKKE